MRILALLGFAGLAACGVVQPSHEPGVPEWRASDPSTPELDREVVRASFVFRHVPVAEVQPIVEMAFWSCSKPRHGPCVDTEWLTVQIDENTNTLSVTGCRWACRELSALVPMLDSTDSNSARH